MSHSVRITTTTTTNSSAIVLNTGYLKTVPGLLKLAQLIIGIVCVGIVAYYYRRYTISGTPDLFFLLMAVTFMICTFCLLISCLVSLSTGGIISKTIYEFVYHLVATILLLSASVTLLAEIGNYKHTHVYNPYIVASVLGLINAVLYLISTIMAKRSYL